MAPRKKAKKVGSKKTGGGDTVGFSESVVENLLCPITSALLVCPVLAEDGKLYERSAIERWLSSKKKSPLTNEARGPRLVYSELTRTLVLSAIENGVVDADAAAAWHLESAKAVATGRLSGALSSVKGHLDRAESLSSSTEVHLMLRAVALKSQMDDLDSQKQALLKEAADAGVDAVSIIFGGASPDGGVTMKKFRKLQEDRSKIRIIDDAEEFQRLCERPAPGATYASGWCEEMSGFCGKVYTVLRNQEGESEYRGYVIEDDEIEECEDEKYSIPFDACILVSL